MAANSISLECMVIDIFRSKKIEDGTTWAVLKVYIPGMIARSEELKKLPYMFHLTGIIPMGLSAKDKLKCIGAVVEHEQYEPEFKSTDITLIKPMMLTSVHDCIAEMIGVGRMNASRAVGAYKAETDIIEAMIHNPGKLVAAVGEHCAALIVEKLKAKWGGHKDTLFLQSLGIRASDIKKICASMYGTNIEETLRKNPFELVTDIGFKLCDSIRDLLGFPTNMPERLNAGIIWISETQCRNRGHCAVECEILMVESTSTLLADQDDIKSAVARLLEKRKLIEATLLGQHLVYPERFWNAEQDVIASFQRIMNSEHPELKLEQFTGDFTPGDDQIAALNEISRSSISVLTGGPGTGKTTIIKCILDSALSAELKVVLCAPTGLAARRMKKACKYDATTIHRALGGSIKIPLGDADIVVVDEMSMVGIELFRNLISRVRDGAKLLLVGDPDQLPSIEPGNVLKDINDSAVVPVCRLMKIYRQGEGSLLCENIARINAGKMPIEIPGNNEFTMRFFDDYVTIIEAAKICAKKLMENQMESKLFDVQIIVPTNAGSLGAEGLNRELRTIFNELAVQSPESERIAKFIIGDKVIQCENDYDRDVVNGEIGCVSSLGTAGSIVVQFDEHGVNYNTHQQSQLKHAYAITVHKSQASEFPFLTIPIAECHGPLLYRKLLYTAFSRGKKKVVIIGHRSALEKAIANNSCDVRYTGLAVGLEKMLGKKA